MKTTAHLYVTKTCEMVLFCQYFGKNNFPAVKWIPLRESLAKRNIYQHSSLWQVCMLDPDQIYPFHKVSHFGSNNCRHELTDLIDEDDTGLDFDSQWEDGSCQLLRLSVPHVCQRGGLKVDELAARRFGRRLCNHGLPTSWWTKQ